MHRQEPQTTGTTVRLARDELDEIRLAVAQRRAGLVKLRKKMTENGLDTFPIDEAVEVLDRTKTAIGDEPEDMFSQLAKDTLELPEGVDPETGEIEE